MPKKKVDSRVRTLIENGIKQRHRTMFVLVGDRGREQVIATKSSPFPLPSADVLKKGRRRRGERERERGREKR
jgi:hypothetical protein